MKRTQVKVNLSLPFKALIEMMLNDPDLPQELRDILGEIEYDEDDE